jgi:hypothetical protein
VKIIYTVAEDLSLVVGFNPQAQSSVQAPQALF